MEVSIQTVRYTAERIIDGARRRTGNPFERATAFEIHEDDEGAVRVVCLVDGGQGESLILPHALLPEKCATAGSPASVEPAVFHAMVDAYKRALLTVPEQVA